MNALRTTNGNGDAAPSTPSHWAALKGRWAFDLRVSVYEGHLEDQPQPYGLALP